ncbi:helix-turn-helix protein [Anseongella ginsenosidimutans]|uniref:Helix-turn-helix protein n=1 Tax=Anseongella ginsenosidimutans TaxID=496056 RepID=A0A4R3KXG2_9SPHI|nr:helix-turn-helix transcriptional regulator [Anseongella ginsenosidimutans]QEC50970.1 helix-turn-helix transcriptional regulator [Anseongella ginsenosidimutans]TCS90385.1 helix-turn-helix protein [Anseongella ginsenosidimutans]
MKLEQSFGETVKRLREKKNLPLRAVAEALNIDTSTLGKIEKNNRKPTKQLIDKFARYFKASEKELLIAFLSDKVVYQVMDEEDLSIEVLKAAEQKIKYLNRSNL